ncbi:MAG: hypothetical protein JOZ51_20010, partial [Chloroflexi bacterium]|nr:hypothetical protein [Chloroflexota bacterium]
RTEATMYAVRAGIVTIDRAEPTLLASQPAEALPAEPVVVTDREPAIEETPAEPEPQPVVEPTVTPIPTVQTPQTQAVTEPIVASRRGGWLIWALAGVALLGLILAGVWWSGAFGSNEIPEASADLARWQELPAAQTARAGFAIASSTDKLYVIGGESAEGVLSKVERYDASSGTWTELSQKPTPVTDVRAVVLGGKLYVPGGRRSNNPSDITAVVERYDPNTESWETLRELPQPRSGYALAALEGKLYLFGGWDGATYRSEVFEYDPERESWRERTSMPTARSFADAGVVEGSIYVIGGENQSGRLANNEVYTPAQEGAQPWARRAPLPQPRSRFGVAVALSVIHVIGGDPDSAASVKYNARTDNWQPFGGPPQSIGSQPGVVQQDVSIVVLGGKTGENSYSPAMQAYQALSTVFLPRQ